MYRVEITIDEDVLKLALQELLIDQNPPSITTNAQKVNKWKGVKGFYNEEWGHYIPAENHVLLQTLPPSLQRMHLHHLVPHVRETLLHELRHAYQYANWSPERRARMHDGGYWKCDCEVDARKWSYAAATGDKYRKILTVERQPVGAGMKLP